MQILLADDHALIRAGLRNELAELADRVEFVEAVDAASLLQAFETHDDLDLAVIDLSMPGMKGAATIAELRRRFPAVPVIVLSAADAADVARSALRAGAAGFIPKTTMARVMLQAMRLVLAGGVYVPSELVGIVNRPDPKAQPDAKRLTLLSERQREVLSLLARGMSNKMIARELGVTEGTVKTHVATIFDVLNVHNRVSAVAAAQALAGAGRSEPGP